MVMAAVGKPLELHEDHQDPAPGAGRVAIDVEACAVCRTDLHILDGDLPEPSLPLIPGHQVVGIVREAGKDTGKLAAGMRVGVPWLGWTCGSCRYCAAGAENLCERARFTGYHLDGGFAERCVADVRFAFPVPEGYPAVQAAPLLCAGLIGFRCYRMAGDVGTIGLYGFGAAAHILAQVARHDGVEVFAFTRPGDVSAQRFARDLGASWSGGSDEAPPTLLDAAILFAPVGDLVPAALRAVRKGGTVVCGGIHMSDIPSFPYEILWGERVVRSVANLTRTDGEDFLGLAPEIPVRTTVREYPLEGVNQALSDLRDGRLEGAAVIVP
jgi:propanol-preferring alcohol dehydrogenase